MRLVIFYRAFFVVLGSVSKCFPRMESDRETAHSVSAAQCE
jgi:hypothetical protein